MSDSLATRSRLESVKKPTAIIHSGMFVYANRAFLDIFSFENLDDLQAVPVLDLIAAEDQAKIKNLLHRSELDQSGKISEIDHLLHLKSAEKEFSTAYVKFDKTEFEEEQCIQIELHQASDSKLVNKLRSLSWGYYLSIAVLLFLSSLPNLLLIKLDINNAPKVYFPPDEPAVVIDNKIRETFPTDQVIVFLFEGVALYSDGFLNAYHELAGKLEEHPLIRKVMSVTTQEHISGSADGFYVAPLMDVDALDETHPSERAEIIQNDRFAKGGLISKDSDALSMVIIPQDAETSLTRLKLLQDINAAVKEVRLDGYLKSTAGQVPLDVAELESMLRDNMIFIPATTTIGLLMIWWLFRRILAVVTAGAVIGVIVSSTIALYVMFDKPFTLIASITPPLLSALTIAALVHLYNALNYASLRGYIGKVRVDKALEEIKRPALFTALTTAAGLASLGLSPIPAIAMFGLMASVGVVLIFIVVIYIVPQIFIHWDHSEWPSGNGGLRWMDIVVRKIGALGLRYPGYVLGVTAVILAAGIPQIANIKVETNLQEFFSTEHQIRQSTDHIDEVLVGTMPLEVVFNQDVDAFKLPENLQRIKKFQQWAESQDEIDKSTSIVDFIEEMNWGFNEEISEFRSIPEDADLISQYLLVYDGEDLYDLVDYDFQTTRITLNVNVHSANDIGHVIEKINQYLEANAMDLNPEIAGVGRLFSDMEELLVNGQVYSLGGALGLIFALMLVLWRSVWQSLICMLPNLAPIVLIFIVMGIFNIWLDMATAMIASVAVGIAVDDTIHVFHGFIKRLKKGSTAATAILRTTSHAGRAVMTTTIILAAQFMILLTSAFIPTSNFGMLTSIGLIAALLFDLLVLPAILILLYKNKQLAKPAEATDAK